ncbi:SIS domain-containing protein [Sulfobacillus thermosulfidooxidans]
MVRYLLAVRSKNGRVFFLGVGGGAAHASHAVGDFRKTAGIESYSPSDNVAEITAQINDSGWHLAFKNWLIESRLNQRDCIFVLSVGGGDDRARISTIISEAVKYAKSVEATVIGIVGRSSGVTATLADACIVVPEVDPLFITALTESFQAVILHLLVTHPDLMVNQMTWEQHKATNQRSEQEWQ